MILPRSPNRSSTSAIAALTAASSIMSISNVGQCAVNMPVLVARGCNLLQMSRSLCEVSTRFCQPSRTGALPLTGIGTNPDLIMRWRTSVGVMVGLVEWKEKGEARRTSPCSQHWLGAWIVHPATVVRDGGHLSTGNAPIHDLQIGLGLHAVPRRHDLPFQRDHWHNAGAQTSGVADSILEIVDRAASTG